MKDLLKVNSPIALKAGLKLALINSALLIAAGIVLALIFSVVSIINRLGIPLPQPIVLVLILFGIPYYVFFYSYGKQYGRLVGDKPFVKGLTVGMLGQLPGMALRFIVNNQLQLDGLKWDELIRIFNIFVTVFIIVLPLMCALGTLDKEQKHNKRTKSL